MNGWQKDSTPNVSYTHLDVYKRQELSRRWGLCSRSLSIKFKAEMGMGIPEYIHREKLREARYLLDLSLIHISVTSPVQPKRSLRCGPSVGISKKLSRWLHWMFCCKRFTRFSEQVK